MCACCSCYRCWHRSVYERYIGSLLEDITLTDGFCRCLQLLHCRVCGTRDTVRHTVETRADGDNRLPLGICLDVRCVVCDKATTSAEFFTDRGDVQHSIVQLISSMLRDYVKDADNLPYQPGNRCSMISLHVVTMTTLFSIQGPPIKCHQALLGHLERRVNPESCGHI